MAEPHINLRRRRAEYLAARAHQAVSPFLDQQSDNARSAAYNALLELFSDQGGEVPIATAPLALTNKDDFQ